MNFGLVFAIFIILYILFFVTLQCLTNHGKEIMIPDLKGKKLSYSIDTLKKLHFEVTIDSSYEPTLQPLTILKQIPDSGSVVKTGRTIFITVNKIAPPLVPMPNLLSLSYRSAELILKNNKCQEQILMSY